MYTHTRQVNTHPPLYRFGSRTEDSAGRFSHLTLGFFDPEVHSAVFASLANIVLLFFFFLFGRDGVAPYWRHMAICTKGWGLTRGDMLPQSSAAMGRYNVDGRCVRRVAGELQSRRQSPRCRQHMSALRLSRRRLLPMLFPVMIVITGMVPTCVTEFLVVAAARPVFRAKSSHSVISVSPSSPSCSWASLSSV